ncbi:conjugal transfer protein TraO [Aquimarina sp. MMG016]|uniref:conjugal transfer protein TraO n=1 Tax=Aquimarina sp. MMG016 TaxID=2822690 RepID=UPI001B3A6EF6|nr:conjugal transfer protein TraO [Aquimarina sp. MMG016]MBQ4821930.1 conjugal transfer protein TraO [Aquimarina sp. MMG016]
MKIQLINKLLLVFIISVFTHSLNAQSHKTDLSLTGGIVQDGFGVVATLDYKVNDFDFLQFNVQASFSNLEVQDVDVPVNLYAFNPGFFFDVIRNNSRKFALSLGAGATLGYEVINNGDDKLDNGQLLLIDSKFVYGAYAGIDADIFIIPTFTINIKINEMYHVNSDIGEFSPYIGVGGKLILF